MISTRRNFHGGAVRIGLVSIILIAGVLSNACKDNTDSSQLLETFLGIAAATTAECNARASKTQAGRSFSTSFESVSDFDGSYLVPQNYQNAVTHDLDTTQVRTGSFSHRGNIYGAPTTCVGNCNHRGYPTIQLHKLAQGSFRTPVLVEFYTYLTMSIARSQWFSFATFSTDASDLWSRTVLVNLGDLNEGGGNYMHLMHVPTQGVGVRTYQTSDTISPNPYPQSQWVKVSVCLDFQPGSGSARAFQDGVLVSSAAVADGCGTLEQAHFGMYAPPQIVSGTIYNDDLTISEVAVCPY